MEELFRKSVPVSVKSSDRDERQVDIGITILLNVATTPVYKKELIVRLTDEGDPFFLYTLALGEADFQGLKSQQGLLVDFGAFPQKFIDLLELCLSEAGKSSPKFLLQFTMSASGPSVLNVVETNPFRHLNHLSLKFISASDTYLKKYLAECLLGLKDENAKLSEELVSTKTDLSAQLAQCEETLSNRSQELARLKSDWSAHSTSLSSEHTASLTAEREKALQTQTDIRSRYEQEKREMEQAHSAKVESMESHLHELEESNKELTDHKYRSEAAIRELKAKLKTTEEECGGLRVELQQLRRDNSSLDAGAHEKEKSLTQLRTRVAVLEQELSDKEQVISRTSELLESSAEQRKSCEAALEQRQRQITKLDTAFKSASQEVMKGNEIIQKLQAEMRNVKSKLKLKNMVTTQQEKLLGEKEVVIERQKHEVQAVKDDLAKKLDELKKMEESLEESKQKLEESQEQIKTNENVINWLNKQMNEQMLGRPPLTAPVGFPPRTSAQPQGALSSSAGHTLSSIRPSPSGVILQSQRHSLPLPTTTTGTAGLLGMPRPQLQHRPQFSSTPSLPQTSVGQGGQLPAPRQVLGSLASQENVRQHQVLFRGPGVKKSSIPVPSPLSSHSLSANSSGTPNTTSGSQGGFTKKVSSPNQDGEPWLDPKYLPQEPPTNPATVTENTKPGSVQVSTTPGHGVLKTGAGGAALQRKGAYVTATGKTETEKGAKWTPLVSAYFPKASS